MAVWGARLVDAERSADIGATDGSALVGAADRVGADDRVLDRQQSGHASSILYRFTSGANGCDECNYSGGIWNR